MAIKSIIDIEINDTEFQRFAAMFSRYKDALDSAPGLWQQVGEKAGSAAKASSEIGSSVAAGAYALHKLASDNAQVTRHAQSQSRSWSDMARSAGRFASHIGEATRSLLRWGTLTGLISGILGAGGLFGIERLATSAGSQRRNALGLGVTPGEANAFETNFGRIIDPSTMLTGVNQALHDVTKRVGLYGAGLNEDDLKGKDTAQVSAELLTHLKKIADQTPDALMGNVLTARHLDQFISLQDFERLKNTPAAELEQYKKSYQTDSSTLNLTQAQAKAWQDLQVQLHRAGETIETVFIKGLTPLAPQIEHLSAAFTKVVSDLLSSPQVKIWIDEFATGIKWLGDYLASPQFRQDVQSFFGYVSVLTTNVGQFAAGVAEFWNTSKGLRDFFADQYTKTVKDFGDMVKSIIDTWNGAKDAFNVVMKFFGLGQKEPDVHEGAGAPALQGGNGQPGGGSFAPGFEQYQGFGEEPPPPSVQKEAFDRLEGQNGLPQGLLDAVYKTESNRGKNLISSAGALGPFQFLPGTAKQEGVQNPFSFDQSSKGAARYLRELKDEFHGDIAKAAAAYNWGPGNVEKDVQQYGAEWRSHLPAETSKYVDKVTGGISGRQPGMVPNSGKPTSVNINIHNNTGGNSTVSASQLAI